MRTNKIKDRLLREHDRLNQGLKELQQIKNKDPARARELFLEFKSGLLRHIAWEEEILFPLIECRTEESLIHLLTIHSAEEEKILYPWIEMTLTEADQDAALNQMDQLTWIHQNK